MITNPLKDLSLSRYVKTNWSSSALPKANIWYDLKQWPSLCESYEV